MKWLRVAPYKLLIALLIVQLGSVSIMYRPVKAALVKPESALFQVLERNKDVFQFYLEVSVDVFDPEAFAPLQEEINIKLIPNKLSERSYLQRIVFVRDEFISIETVDDKGKTLHIYIHEIGGKSYSQNLDRERVFKDEEIFFPSLVFFTKHVAMFIQGLGRYEIVPNRLQFDYQGFLVLYEVGSDTNNLIIDPNSFKVLGFQSQLQIQGRYYPLTIEFSEWNRQKESIPEVTRFFVNSRLFKEVRIESIEFSRIFAKRNSVIKEYQHLLPARFPFSFETNYGQ